MCLVIPGLKAEPSTQRPHPRRSKRIRQRSICQIGVVAPKAQPTLDPTPQGLPNRADGQKMTRYLIPSKLSFGSPAGVLKRKELMIVEYPHASGRRIGWGDSGCFADCAFTASFSPHQHIRPNEKIHFRPEPVTRSKKFQRKIGYAGCAD